VVPTLDAELINHCTIQGDRFAVLHSDPSTDTLANVANIRPPQDTTYAAFYMPWIKVFNPLINQDSRIPPSGHIAGIYAQTDIERGVFKAPANVVVAGARALEFQITKGEQDLLNPRGVNCIRAFPARGIRVWGARTSSTNSLWKYINVRRLFLFLEESIEEGTQWVVFEPNDEKLWARVKQTITQFLITQWRNGALMGTKPDQAFFVKVDRTTMTQDDMDNGRMICIIGVAPVKPAEFVIFRIAQFSGGSEVTEV
jgi:phage tail sheath protein FI